MTSNRPHSLKPHPINRPYLVINLVFAIIFAGIVFYAALYDPDQGNHPLPSAYQLATGQETISTGLSRSFSALVRFRFDDAREFNSYGPRVFLFFAVQLVLRITLLFMMLRGKLAVDSNMPADSKLSLDGTLKKRRWLILTDATQAIVLFVTCFWPFLAYWKDVLFTGWFEL